MSLVFNSSPVTGTFNTVTAGSAVNGNPLAVSGGSFQRIKTLSAVVAVTAATSTITLTAKWQVSNDKTIWFDVAYAAQNPAAVALATGTAAIVTKVVPAPDAVYGHAYARCVVVVGVATGGAGDLYSIGYNYRQLTGAE